MIVSVATDFDPTRMLFTEKGSENGFHIVTPNAPIAYCVLVLLILDSSKKFNICECLQAYDERAPNIPIPIASHEITAVWWIDPWREVKPLMNTDRTHYGKSRSEYIQLLEQLKNVNPNQPMLGIAGQTENQYHTT